MLLCTWVYADEERGNESDVYKSGCENNFWRKLRESKKEMVIVYGVYTIENNSRAAGACVDGCGRSWRKRKSRRGTFYWLLIFDIFII